MKRVEFWGFILLLDTLVKYFILYKYTGRAPTIKHMELCSIVMLLTEWEEVWRRMDAYICMAESFCFSAETITAFFFFLLKVYLFWLPGCEPAFSSCNKWGLLFAVVLGLLTTVTPLISVHRLWSAGSVVVAHKLSCSEACGIFPEKEWNPVPCISRGILNHQSIKEPLYIVYYVVHLL